MKHYISVKNEHPDVIIFYRLGDFYEVPFEIRSREKNNAIRKLERIVYVPLFVFVMIYLVCWKSGLGNDIISIASLGLSLTDVTIVDVVSNYILKKEKVL